MKYVLFICLFFTSYFDFTSILAQERLSEEVDEILDYIYDLDSSQSSVESIVSGLILNTEKKISNKDEYALYALVYLAYIKYSDQEYIYGSWCKQALNSLMKNYNRTISVFLQIAKEHYLRYDPATKVLLLNVIHLILNTKLYSGKNPVPILNILVKDADPDISKAARIILLKVK